MTAEKAQAYCRSAFDVDLRFVLEDSAHCNTRGRCLVYIHKVIRGQAEQTAHRQSTSEDTVMSNLITHEALLLSSLCDDFLLSLATTCNLQVYTTTTECPNGYTATRRRCYADSLCQQVYADLVKLTECLDISHFWKGTLFSDVFAREQAEQEDVCNVLSQFYEVIRPEEDEIRTYVQNEQWRPLVVTGGPCRGKTVLLAHCSQQIKLWLQDSDPVVIQYFCGLSVNHSPKHILSGLCYQIARSYQIYFSTKPDPNLDSATNSELNTCYKDMNLDVLDHRLYMTEVDMSISQLKHHLSRLITLLPSPKHPLVLLLDGLDQMDYNYGPQVIESLPSPLPANIKLLLTVSPNRKHIVQALELHYPQCNLPAVDEKSGFVCLQLEVPNRRECVKMLASQLATSGRCITSGQQALVNQALTSCSLPLYARLLHKHASLWHSDSDVTESTLPDGVHSSISTLLDHLEHKHGYFLVSHALCYLTLSITGLTAAELTDLLSNDNKVLAQYIKHQDSFLPKMRIPQVDVEMVLLDLKPFLNRGTVAGAQVLFWISRHFALVITKRYLSAPIERVEFHSELVDYFSGRWSCGCAKPLQLMKDNTDQKIHIDRQPSSQLFFFTSSSKDDVHVNLKKILELPYHLKKSGQIEELRKLELSLDFQQAMIQAGLLTDLVAMLDGEEVVLKEQSLLANILKSSTCFLNDFPLDLTSVMELTLMPYKDVLPELQTYINEIKQVRKKRGIGVELYPAPSTVPPFKCIKSQAKIQKLREVVVTQHGVVIEIVDDGSVWVWKGIGNDLVKLSLSIEYEEVIFAEVKSSGHFVLLSSLNNKHFLWNVNGADNFQEIKDSTPRTVENFVACPENICIQWRDERFVSVFKISCGTMRHFHCQKPVTCLSCSSDCSTMYCGHDEGTVSVFDTNTTSLLCTCSNENNKTLISIIVCEDRQQMACVDNTGSITLWDIATKAPSFLKELSSKAKSDDILNIDFSLETRCLLACYSHQITLWNTCEWKESDQFLASKGRSFTKALLSQDGHLFLALLSQSSSVLVWRLSTGQCVLSLKASQSPCMFFKMASNIISFSDDGSLAIWDSEMVYTAGIAPKMACGVKQVVVELDGDGFFASDGSETVWKWSLDTSQPIIYLIHNSPVEKIRLSPNSLYLVTLSSEDIYIWNTECGQNIFRIRGSEASDILITPNSNFGVCLSENGLPRVWKLVNGTVVCTIRLPLLDAQISAESTFLIGCHCGELLGASLWSGGIAKKFTCNECSEKVVAFQTLSKHPDFAIVLLTSGSLYTWNVAEETVFRHFKVQNPAHCQPQDVQLFCNGSYALLSTEEETLTLLDLFQFKLCSFKTNGAIFKACLDTSGCYAICCSSQNNTCKCYLHSRLVLSVLRLEDGNTEATLYLPKNPTTLAVHRQHCVVVGFEDGAVAVYYFNTDGELPKGRKDKLDENQCSLDQALCTWLPLTAPNISWS